MLKLVSIEFYKLKNTKYFWILFGLFLLFLIAIPTAFRWFLNYLTSIGEDIAGLGIPPNQMPFFDFVDLWQNLTWVYKTFSILLGFIMVISINNEYTYGTIKQNVIDGLSRKQFLWTKLSFIIVLSGVVSSIALLIGLILGSFWSPSQGLDFILLHIDFIPAYFFHLIAFQLFCLVLSLLIKRPGITIALLVFYIFVIEPILTTVLFYKYKLELLANLFPISAIGNIIPMPWTKYALKETQTNIHLDDALILGAYIMVLYLIANYLIVKKDLR